MAEKEFGLHPERSPCRAEGPLAFAARWRDIFELHRLKKGALQPARKQPSGCFARRGIWDSTALTLSLGVLEESSTQLKTMVFSLSSTRSKFRAFGRPEPQLAHSSGLINNKEIPEPREERNKAAVVTPYTGGRNMVPPVWLRVRGLSGCSAP